MAEDDSLREFGRVDFHIRRRLVALRNVHRMRSEHSAHLFYFDPASIRFANDGSVIWQSRYYVRVGADGEFCTCPDFTRYRIRCKHVLALLSHWCGLGSVQTLTEFPLSYASFDAFAAFVRLLVSRRRQLPQFIEEAAAASLEVLPPEQPPDPPTREPKPVTIEELCPVCFGFFGEPIGDVLFLPELMACGVCGASVHVQCSLGWMETTGSAKCPMCRSYSIRTWQPPNQ
jgi:hypothetical protein